MHKIIKMEPGVHKACQDGIECVGTRVREN